MDDRILERSQFLATKTRRTTTSQPQLTACLVVPNRMEFQNAVYVLIIFIATYNQQRGKQMFSRISLLI